MVADSVEIVMFAIRSSIKLGLELRQAYVDNTKRRDLVLPLPNFFSSVDIVSAANYFAAPPGSTHAKAISALEALLAKRQTPGQTLGPDEEAQVLIYYQEFFNLDLAQSGGLGTCADGSCLNGNEFNALITVRQWQRGSDPNPSTLQRVAGSFIEIGVDYFANVPGALNHNSPMGKVLIGFLSAMSEINFSEEQLGELPGRLFVATLDTVSEQPELLSADPKIQELVKFTTKSLSSDVAHRLGQLGDADLVKAQKVGDWAELVFRSVLSSAGGLVLSDPKRFLGVEGSGEAELVSKVGQSVLGLVLGDSGVDLERVFTRQGLETVTKAALIVLGDHPEILVRSNNKGLQQLLSAIAAELGQFDTFQTPDLLPEITRIILEKTGENLALLWPDLANHPRQHLLLTAAQETLRVLTRQPKADQKWTLQFSSTDLLAVTDVVLEDLAANPTWLLDAAGQVNDNLRIALEAALTVLRNHADHRLSPGTAVDILTAVLSKVGSRKEFLDLLPAGTSAGGQTLIAAALDAIFRNLFDPNLDPRAAWQVVRQQTILELVDLSLAQLAKVPLSSGTIATFGSFIEQQMGALSAGAVWDPAAFAAKLQQTLTT